MNLSIETTTTYTHHMIDDLVSPKNYLDLFIQHFPYPRYLRFDQSVLYEISHRAYAESMERHANEIISKHGLLLETELRKGSADSTLIIKIRS